MAQVDQRVEQPIGQTSDPGPNRINANRFEMPEADFHCCDREIVERAILEAGLTGRQQMANPSDGGEVHCAAGEPGSAKRGERSVFHEQAADACGIPEHLVEGDADELRAHTLKVEPIGRDERGGIEQDVPATGVRRATSSSGCLTPEKLD